MKKLHGTGVALVTPFHENGSVDYASLEKVIAHTAKGADYFVVMGTTGEVATLDVSEKKEVLKFVMDHNPGRLPIVYGVGGNNLKHVLAEIEEINFRGVSAILSVCPYYSKPSQEGIYRHFKTIAGAAPVPVILYNVPGRTGVNMTAKTTLRLAKLPNILGIKEASRDLEQCMAIMKDKPRSFMLISGDDLLTVSLYTMGAVGVISVMANAFPRMFSKIKGLCLSGDHQKAAKVITDLLEINPLMFEEGSPTGIKAMLSQMGICKPYVRLPLAPASTRLMKKIDAAYSKMG